MKKERKIAKIVRGRHTIDGAGVHLVRVLDNDTAKDFDPFLMLDSFDSPNPDDYTAGFPMHPHRGIETITYLIEGDIEHEDSLGNKGSIKSGQSQWMTAGSGIMHQEMPKASDRMLGLQIWLNLPKKLKMTDPHYFDITDDMIGFYENDDMVVRIHSGEYAGKKGINPPHVKATIYDISLSPGKSITLDTNPEENVFLFLIEGDAILDNDRYTEKSAVLFDEGDTVTVTAPKDSPSRFIFFSGKPLREEIAWGGPIVMNSEKELQDTFRELRDGSFIKHNANKEM